MTFNRIVNIAGLTLCTCSVLEMGIAQAAPKPKAASQSHSPKREQHVSTPRLKVGDTIYAMHGAHNEVVFDGKGTVVKVTSLAPLTLSLNQNGGRGAIGKKGAKVQFGDFAVLTSTGQLSGVTGIVTFPKPYSVLFTRITSPN